MSDAVLFFDECEALFRTRDHGGADRLLRAMLQEIEKLSIPKDLRSTDLHVQAQSYEEFRPMLANKTRAPLKAGVDWMDILRSLELRFGHPVQGHAWVSSWQRSSLQTSSSRRALVDTLAASRKGWRAPQQFCAAAMNDRWAVEKSSSIICDGDAMPIADEVSDDERSARTNAHPHPFRSTLPGSESLWAQLQGGFSVGRRETGVREHGGGSPKRFGRTLI